MGLFPARPASSKWRPASASDGTITAWEFHNYNSGGSGIRPSYDIDNQRAVFHPSSSPLRQGSYRALAATANHFARESHIDDLARAVELDPLEFRLKNLKDAAARAVLEAAAKQFGWEQATMRTGRGYRHRRRIREGKLRGDMCRGCRGKRNGQVAGRPRGDGL